MDFSAIQKDIGQWAKEKIKGCTWRGITTHMKHEVEELEAELRGWETHAKPEGGEVVHLSSESAEQAAEFKCKTAKEIADIVILACHLASVLDIDLEFQVISKMETNKKRLWSKPNPETGVIHHLGTDE